MKKLLAIILSLSLTVALAFSLTSCGDNSSNGGKSGVFVYFLSMSQRKKLKKLLFQTKK